MGKQYPNNHHRPILGYMTNGIYGQGGKGGYYSTLWDAIQETARANAVKLICYLGGTTLKPLEFQVEPQRDQVFDLISEDLIDGLIVNSAALVSTFGYVKTSKMCARYKRLPIISIGIPLNQYPYLSIDNRGGERAVVDHLIEAHGCRRIAFLRGPDSNEDANARYQAFQEALCAHEIPLDAELVVQGSFEWSTGEYAAQTLLARREVSEIDAVVASSDNMALGLLSAFQKRGIQVPYDIAVVGFDDIPDSRLSFPPLTTVRQPIYEIGRQAVEFLLGELNQVETPDNTRLETQLMVRGSCGCALQAAPVSLAEPEITGPALLQRRRMSLVDEMLSALNCPPSGRPAARQRAEQLLCILDNILNDPQQIKRLTAFLSDAMREDISLPWHRCIYLYFQERLSAGQPTEAGPQPVIWQAVWQAANETAWYSQAFHGAQVYYAQEVQSELFRRVSQALVTTFDLATLMDTAYRLLPELGIKGCWIALYPDLDRDRQMVALKLAYDPSGRSGISQQCQPYPSQWLLPKEIIGLDRSFEIIVTSLYSCDQFFGFIVFEMERPDQKIIEMVTSQIGTAIQGARVVSELQRMEAEFRRQANTDPLTGIYNRRALYTLAEPVFNLSIRHDLPLSMAMLDLDNFKRVNDCYSHAVGDQLLQAITAFIQAQIRGTDIFGRMGGEEFLVIMPQTTLDGAAVLLERICRAIEAHIFQIGEIDIPMTISAGVAALNPKTDSLVDQLIDKADRALYQAKAAGKNSVSKWQSDL